MSEPNLLQILRKLDRMTSGPEWTSVQKEKPKEDENERDRHRAST